MRIGWLLGIGVLLMFFALNLQLVTLASGQYAAVLVAALALTLLADCCFAAVFRRGGPAVRCFSIVLLLPTLFVVIDSAWRLPSLFEGGHKPTPSPSASS
jgi:hypothetical protein